MSYDDTIRSFLTHIYSLIQMTDGNPEGLGTFDNIFQSLLQISIIASCKYSQLAISVGMLICYADFSEHVELSTFCTIAG
jgi:hypothetical protein